MTLIRENDQGPSSRTLRVPFPNLSPTMREKGRGNDLDSEHARIGGLARGKK